MKISETLRELRLKKEHTQVEVAEATNITQTYLSQIETGNKEPSSTVLKKLCKYYGVPPQIVIWQSLEEKDIPKGKKKSFRILKQPIDKLIAEFLK